MRLLSFASLLFVAGCFSGAVPDTVILECAAAGDCPVGLECAVDVGRCVSAEVLAAAAPVLEGEVAIAPALASTDTVVRVAFSVDQALAFEPVVTIENTPFVFALSSESHPADGNFVFNGTIGIADPPEGTATIVAVVTAASGRPTVLRLGTVEIDRTPNRIDGAALVAGSIAPGGSSSIAFNTLDAVDPDHHPRVFFVDEEGVENFAWTEETANTSAAVASFSFAVTLPNPSPLADGSHDVRAILLDNAGNESAPVFLGTLDIDSQAPDIVEANATIQGSAPSAVLLGAPVSAAGVGATVRVVFSATEDLDIASNPVVSLSCVSGSEDFARPLTETSARFFTYLLHVSETTPEGDCTVIGTLRDPAGNESEVDVVHVSIDHTAPPALIDPVGAGATLARAPWGATDLDADGEDDRGTKVIVTSTSEAGAIAVALDPATDAVLARADFSGAGAVLDLGAIDRKNVDIEAVDRAGNEGPRRRVRNGVWVATLGDKEVGNLVANPHRGVAHRALPIALDDDDGHEIGAEAAGTDGVFAEATTTARWRIGPDGSTSADLSRVLPSAVFDDANGAAFLFGGVDQGIASDDTFRWDGNTWELLSLDDRPPARSGAAFAYDKRRGVAVLFGGKDINLTPLDDTWEFDGEIWRERHIVGPPARGETQAAYDPGRGVVVLFGGRGVLANSFFGDTWTFDGESWAHPTSAGPTARARGGIAFDPNRNAVLLCGGLMQSGSTDDDVWAFNGSTWDIVPLTGTGPALNSPTVFEHRMVFDPTRNAPVVLAMNSVQQIEMQLGVIGATSWSALNTLPTPRSDLVFFFDPKREELVIAGGGSTTDVLGNGAGAWVAADGNPGIRSRLGSTFDPHTGAVIFMAGRTGAGTRAVDSWIFDGNRFRLLSGANLAAGADDMANATPAADPLTFGGIVNAVGFVNAVKRFNGTSWVAVTTTGTAPTARGKSAMAVQPGTANVILFGGMNGTTTNNPLGDTFRLTGTAWTPLNIPGPSPRFGHAMAVDQNRNGIVLYGGDDDNGAGSFLNDDPATTPFADTWLFANGAWSDISSLVGTGPGPRTNHQMATDPVTGSPLLFSGTKANGARDNVLWELTPTGWEVVPAGPAPPPTDQAALVADNVRDHVVLFGGTGRDGSFVLDRAPGGRPAVAFYADLATLGLGSSTVSNIDVTAIATGAGAGTVAPVSGAELFVWSQGAWTSVDAHASSTLDVLAASLTPDDALFKSKTVNVAVVSPAQNGSTPATIDVDHIEVRVDYEVTP